MIKKRFFHYLIFSLILSLCFNPTTIWAKNPEKFAAKSSTPIPLDKIITIDQINGSLLEHKKSIHFPMDVKIKPQQIPLPFNWSIPELEPAIKDGYLNLYELKAELINRLSKENLRKLLEFLSKMKVHIQWTDKDQHIRSGKWYLHHKIHTNHWNKTNAAAALAFLIGTSNDEETFSTIVAAAPDDILPIFDGEAAVLLSVDVTSRILIKLISQVHTASDDPKHIGNNAKIANAAGNLVYLYIQYWGEKKPEYLREALVGLAYKTKILTDKDGNLSLFTPAQKGILIGSLFAGTMNHVYSIKRTDEKRLLIAAATSYLITSATKFIPISPVGGTVALAAASAEVIYTFLHIPRDYTAIIKQVQGQIEMGVLRFSTPKNREDIQDMLLWMRAAIHVNGQYD